MPQRPPRPAPIAGSTTGVATPRRIRAYRRPDLIDAGRTDDAIRARRIRGDLRTLRPGLYVDSRDVPQLSAVTRHRYLLADVMADVVPSSVVSHVSAAVLWGLPLWNASLARVHVTRDDGGGGHRTRWVHAHRVAESVPCGRVDGFRVTTPARTVIDCARALPFESGVVLADAALHRELVTTPELEAEALRAVGKEGAARARRVAAFANPRSESVGESRSRVLLRKFRLPAMELQHEIRDSHGLLVARTDFAIPQLRVAGEFDGKVKYGVLLPPGRSAVDAVVAEKRREDAIRDLDWGVVRWTWPELRTPELIADRWRRAIARARRRPR